MFDFSRTFRGVNTDFFFNFSDIFLISPTSDLSDFLLNRAVRAVAAVKIWAHFEQWTIKISLPLFSIFSLVAILDGSRDHRTQFWKGAIQGPFYQSLVQIGPVASEELIKMWKVNGRTDDDGRSVVTIAHMTLWVRWAKNDNVGIKCGKKMIQNKNWNELVQKLLFFVSCHLCNSNQSTISMNEKSLKGHNSSPDFLLFFLQYFLICLVLWKYKYLIIYSTVVIFIFSCL